MNASQKFILFQLLPWTFIASGGVALSFGIFQVIEGIGSKNWPQVKGKVIASEVGRSSGSISSGGAAMRYRANITYEYEVNGATHIGDRVSVSDSATTSSATHHRIAARYPLGGEVIVYHHPDKPDQALLEPGIRGMAFVLIPAGLLVLAIGIGIKWVTGRLVFEAPIA